jgi:hypothetical protein
MGDSGGCKQPELDSRPVPHEGEQWPAASQSPPHATDSMWLIILPREYSRRQSYITRLASKNALS